MTLNKTNHKAFTESKKNVSLTERFKNYVMENSAIIVGGMMALNGNTNAYRVYRMLNE